MEANILLDVCDVSKNFGVTKALDHVSFSVARGEIHGLIGENGSGKSTVCGVISGMLRPSGGDITFEGKRWSPGDVLEAEANGVCMIVQETGSISGISVAENLFLGNEKQFARGPFVSRRRMDRAAAELLRELGVEGIDPGARAASYDIQTRKLFEIARALCWKPRLLIIDETTTAVSYSGRELIYSLMKRMTAEGGSVIFVSHDLDELMTRCDSMTVLRDGVNVGRLSRSEFGTDRIKQMMVGRKIAGDYFRSDLDGYSDEVVLEAESITTGRDLTNFSLQLHKGEILGVGGLSHSGMHELGKALFGAEELISGRVVDRRTGKCVKNISDAVESGIAYLSKDRDLESLAPESSVYANIASAGYGRNSRFGFLLQKREREYVRRQVSGLDIKCASVFHNVATLSGGNKQKVVFGKWIAVDSELLIMDCPTRGIDVGVKASMYRLIYEMKKAGKSMIFITDELPELIGMCDRIIIMKDGRIASEFRRGENITEGLLIEKMF